MPQADDPFLDWLDEWKLELGAGRPSASTIRFYSLYVTQFVDWLHRTHPDITVPGQLDRTHLRDWVIWQIEDGKAEATRRVRAIAVRKWLTYVTGQPDSGLDTNPAAGLEMPMPKAPTVPIVPDEDVATLLKSMSSNNFLDRRDTAIIRLLFDTGIRRAELVAINMDDMDLRFQQVLVHGKGGYDRIVPFGAHTALALRKYQRTRSVHAGAEDPALFLSSRTAGNGWRLRGGSVREMVKVRCAQAGLQHVYPHQFRHTWAADVKGNGMNDGDIERLAGWRTPLMVRRYGAVVADQQARDSARRLNRGDRL